MTGTRNQALQSHTRLFQLPGVVFGAGQGGWCFQLCPEVWWFKETQTMPNPHRNQAQFLSNHAQLPKAELRGVEVGIHSTALPKCGRRGFHH